MSAASALIEMSAERGGATPRNGQEHFDRTLSAPGQEELCHIG